MNRLVKMLPSLVTAALAALLCLTGGTAVGAEPDAPAGRTPRKRMTHGGAVWSVAFSPDGKTLASGSMDKTVKLWEVATGKVKATLKGHTDAVYSVAFSPDGKTLASGIFDKTILLWDVSPEK
jgi:WD40 repeat protein